MQFLFHEEAGAEWLEISGETAQHLRARRAAAGERLVLKNLRDGYDYLYELAAAGRGAWRAQLVFRSLAQTPPHTSTLAWAVVEPAVIEKTLPALNELGLGTLALVWADFSQRGVRLDLARMRRIVVRSCEQCGRGELMKIAVFESSDEFLRAYPDAALVDFGAPHISAAAAGRVLFVGAEGGFSERERGLFSAKFGLNARHILRSNTAVIAVAGYTLI